MATELTGLMTTQQVLDHHLDTLLKGDLDGLVSDYTDDSILIGPEGPVKGLQAIRTMFAGAIASLFKPGTYAFTLDTTHVAGDVAYIVWHARCGSLNVALGTDTFVVRDGKIAVQTFAAKIDAAG